MGLTTSHRSQVLSPKYDMDAYMATLFGGEARDLCQELGGAKSQTQSSPVNVFPYNYQRSDFDDK